LVPRYKSPPSGGKDKKMETKKNRETLQQTPEHLRHMGMRERKWWEEEKAECKGDYRGGGEGVSQCLKDLELTVKWTTEGCREKGLEAAISAR